jgi:hypothetical protein
MARSTCRGTGLALQAQLDQGLAADVHRNVQKKVTRLQPAPEHGLVVVTVNLDGGVRHAEFVCGVKPEGLMSPSNRPLCRCGAATREGRLGRCCRSEHPDVSVEPGPGLRGSHGSKRQTGCRLEDFLRGTLSELNAQPNRSHPTSPTHTSTSVRTLVTSSARCRPRLAGTIGEGLEPAARP